eukprot:m.266275 g.266275  ORF g.266275 m.266275 type:complete len:855 (+) comp40499_c0_seq22:72-2636(+)
MASEHSGRATIVSPETPPDRTYMDAVKGILSVVQQGVSTTTKPDDRDRVVWVRFEEFGPCEKDAPIVLIIGYRNGLQVWTIDMSGSRLATEVLSLRQDPVRHCKLLASPFTVSDQFDAFRPLLALCDSSCNSGIIPFGTVGIFSLKTGKEVIRGFSFKQEVSSILSNKRVVVVALQNEIHGFDAESLARKFLVTKCYPAPIPGIFPVTLGSRWLAYADRKLTTYYQSVGSVSATDVTSYKASVISAAKSTLGAAQQGISFLSETVGRWTGSPTGESQSEKQSQAVPSDQRMAGIVSVVDIFKIKEKLVVEKQDTGEAIVAHFEAHVGQPIVALSFDPSGQLLVTACKLGHNFHVFRILPHPCHPSLGVIHHLYTLFRGDTEAIVQGISFTPDSRWVAMSTQRGTTHVFPITPYGGPIENRTHTQSHVVNRLSRFHTSAGLGDNKDAGTSSLTVCPAVPSNHFSVIHPPPKTVTVQSLARISSKPMAMPGRAVSPTGSHSVLLDMAGLATSAVNLFYSTEAVPVAAKFSHVQHRRRGSQPESSKPGVKSGGAAVFSIFTVGIEGTLVEYQLKPNVLKGSPDLDTSPIELDCSSVQQWPLQRSISSSPIKMPVVSSSPLMLFLERLKKTPDGSFYEMEDKRAKSSSSGGDQRWLANIEIHTYEAPARRLWMGPQFKFKTLRPAGNAQDEMDDFLGGGATIQAQGNMDLSIDPGLQSLNFHQSGRSLPIPTPGGSHIPTDTDIVVDAGPSSLDFTKLEVPGSWQSDEDSNLAKEQTLVKDLADAMEDSTITGRLSGEDRGSGEVAYFGTATIVHESPPSGPSFHSSSSPHHAMIHPQSGSKIVHVGQNSNCRTSSKQ